MLDIRLLGPLEVAVDGRPIALAGGRERALLALLALHRDRVVSVDEILQSLWPDEPLRDPRHALQASVARLRKMLRDAGDDAAVVTADPGYRVDPGPGVSVDIDRFERLMDAATEVLDSDPEAAWVAIGDGLALFRGEPLADFTYEDWAQGEISRLTEERLAATADRIEIGLSIGKHGRLVPGLEALVLEHPYHERFRGLLMLALYRSGRQEEALATYHDGRKRLDEELGIDPGPELQSIEQAILRQDPQIGLVRDANGSTGRAAADRIIAATPSSNLPVQLTSFVGREDDVAALARLLAERRLVTLIGSGGSGKTRLAIETAQRLRPDFVHGTWFVDLSSAQTRSDGELAIGAVLDVHENYEQSLGRFILDFLQDRHVLLILDNCEQATDELAPLVSDLVGTAPGLTVLITSRQPLRLAGEALRPVDSLALPSLGVPDASAADSPAVRLFAERAELADPSFSLNDGTRADVISICRSTDGIPLAIELAAGQLVGMAVADIAARLRERPIALGEQRRGPDSRQQTFEATIGRSFELLDDIERAVFRVSSVFEGGFSLSAAESISGIANVDVGDVLVRLVQKSTLTQGGGPGSSSRYRMLEPIRQFALEQLRAAGEEDVARSRHLVYFSDLSKRASDGLRSAEQSRWLRAVDIEYANLLAALRWARDVDAHADALLIGTALGPYWRVRGFLSEGRSVARRVIDEPGGDDELRSTLLADVGMLAFFQCDYQETRALSRRAIDGLGDASRSSVRAYAHLVGGLAAWKIEGHQNAIEALERSLGLYQAANDAWGAATAIAYSGMVLMDEGDLAGAERVHERSLKRFREQGDDWGAAFSLSALGSLVLARGEYDEADALLAEALALSEMMEDRWGVARSRMYLAMIALARGDDVAARAGLDAAMDGYQKLHDREDAALCLGGYAALKLAEDAPRDASLLLGAADALRRTVTTTFASTTLERSGDSDLRRTLMARVGEDEFDGWLRQGSRLSWEDARALAAQRSVAIEVETAPM